MNRLTERQTRLINEYYKQCGYKHIKYCISKVFKRQIDGAVLDDYIGIAEEAVCKAASKYDEEKGTKFITFVEMHITSALKTAIRNQNRKKREHENNMDSLDRIVDEDSKTTLGEIIEFIEVDKEDNFLSAYAYLKGLNAKQCIIVILRLLGADYSDIYNVMDMPKSQIKGLVKRMTNYENKCELIKIRSGVK